MTRDEMRARVAREMGRAIWNEDHGYDGGLAQGYAALDSLHGIALVNSVDQYGNIKSGDLTNPPDIGGGVMMSSRRDEMRVECIEAMKAAILTSIPETWGPLVEEAAIGAFDSLHGIARVCPIAVTDEVLDASLWSQPKHRDHMANEWRDMSAAGDLTNPPEEKL